MNQQNKTDRWVEEERLKMNYQLRRLMSEWNVPEDQSLQLIMEVNKLNEKLISQLLSDARREERERIVNGLFKEGKKYVVWLEGNKLSVADTDNFSLPDQDQLSNSKTDE